MCRRCPSPPLPSYPLPPSPLLPSPSPGSLPPSPPFCAIASAANDAHVEANAAETFTNTQLTGKMLGDNKTAMQRTKLESQRGERQQQVFLQAAAAAAAVSSSSSAAAAARYLCCRLPRRAGHIQSRQCHRRLRTGRTFIQRSVWRKKFVRKSNASPVNCVERELFEEGGCGEACVCKAWASSCS